MSGSYFSVNGLTLSQCYQNCADNTWHGLFFQPDPFNDRRDRCVLNLTPCAGCVGFARARNVQDTARGWCGWVSSTIQYVANHNSHNLHKLNINGLGGNLTVEFGATLDERAADESFYVRYDEGLN